MPEDAATVLESERRRRFKLEHREKRRETLRPSPRKSRPCCFFLKSLGEMRTGFQNFFFCAPPVPVAVRNIAHAAEALPNSRCLIPASPRVRLRNPILATTDRVHAQRRRAKVGRGRSQTFFFCASLLSRIYHPTTMTLPDLWGFIPASHHSSGSAARGQADSIVWGHPGSYPNRVDKTLTKLTNSVAPTVTGVPDNRFKT
ncbi:hypothetical protein B0H13DRAFT_1077488 [Mycena leptocephala]|nr:hypothetical protein B0H13DRAFT_1077488 [Mycena leptocephala]